MSLIGYLLVVLALLAVWFLFLYNSLVKWRNTVASAWAQIDVQLKRRYDLIPNLVETVRGYARHERELFEKIARIRTAALTARTPRDVAGADTELAPAIRALFAVVEAYPALKADQQFRLLMEELTATENTKTQQVPSAFLASWFGFGPAEYLEADAVQREVQQVTF